MAEICFPAHRRHESTPSPTRQLAGIKRRKQWIVLVLALLFLLCFLFSFIVGRYGVDVKTVLKIFLSRIFTLEQTWEHNAEIVVFTVRMPRILTAALVGASLSVAGLSFQALFTNPMAAPGILGASSGAGFGAALALYFHLNAAQVSASAFVWGLAAVALAYLASLRLKGNFEWRAHIQGTGWTQWTRADGVSTLGTVGRSLRMEAVEMRKI